MLLVCSDKVTDIRESSADDILRLYVNFSKRRQNAFHIFVVGG